MNRSHKLYKPLIPLFLLLAVLLTMPLAAGARPSAPSRAARTAETVIVVNSGADPDTSTASTCKNASPCTLRRAIVQAGGAKAGERPVFIEFDIPPDASKGYDAALGVWRINLLAGPDPSALPALVGGDIIIAGETQPGGRDEGPKIILAGPGEGEKDGLIAGENAAGADDFNEVTGLAFVNFRKHLVLNSNLNFVSANWFGLAADGGSPFLRGGSAAKGSGAIGVDVSAETAENWVIGNTFLGLDETAVAMRGELGIVSENWFGTNALGEVSKRPSDPAMYCTPADWLGGGGVTVEGSEHEVSDNTFTVLRRENGAQPDAITAGGSGHVMVGNTIGLDDNLDETGTCGRGIRLNNTQDSFIAGSTIAGSALSAISLGGPQYDAVLLSDNVITRQAAWPPASGGGAAEAAIQLEASLPAGLRDFVPAEIISIEGTQVSGTSGSGSPCPNCFIEIFLDDDDGVTETLELLAEIEAASDGSWQAELPLAVKPGYGLRTTSSSAAAGTIPGLGADTTTGLSTFYKAPILPHYLPVIRGE